IFPYPNVSAFLFNRHQRRPGRDVSKSDRKEMQELLLDPRFKNKDLAGVNFDALDKEVARDPQNPWDSDGWKKSPLVIEIPTGIKPTRATQQEANRERQRQQRRGERDLEADKVFRHQVQIFDVNHRNLLHITREGCAEHATATQLHFEGFEERWTPPYPHFSPELVHGEAYQSPAFLEAEHILLESPPEPGCNLPRAILSYMFWSDATHLAQFGNAKAWPIYAIIANLSKYLRCKPSERAAQYVAFIPGIGDDLADKLRALGITPTPALLAHCKREAFHGVWRLILDDDFRRAYEHGIVVDCADGVRRRLYPRIFTYSADYPEKVLIATIKDMGNCPCPRCLVKKANLRDAGLPADHEQRTEAARRDNADYRSVVTEARRRVYEDGIVTNSKAQAEPFMAASWVPTTNAPPPDFKFDIFLALVVDFMHEFELGVWKAVLIHLIRMLYSLGQDKVDLFNERFRKVAPFGRDTIRRFAADVSSLKKLAARDYEDILQCCIPCFEGLFGDYDDDVQDLLYLLSYWHALGKFRKTSDTPLKVFEVVTVHLTNTLRHFADVVCPAFPNTMETDREYRARRDAQAKAKGKASGAANSSAADAGARRHKTFNLNTYKFHSLPDYVESIRRFGTTDSYSTQIGELVHRLVKQHYARTNRRDHESQIIALDVLQRVHERMAAELDEAEVAARTQAETDGAEDDSEDASESAPDALAQPYRIAKEQAHPVNVYEWVEDPERHGDVAYKDFIPKLKTHLLGRELNEAPIANEPAHVYTDEQLEGCVFFAGHRIYEHATAGFNYTTYDVLRAQDAINSNNITRQNAPRSHDVMVHAPKGDRHPFRYARVLAIYHANITFFDDARPKRRDFLFVRWFELDPTWACGPSARRLERVRYLPATNPAAFGFLDPASVIRACHLIPAFALGITSEFLNMSFARDTVLGDYMRHYVSRFVDRDMAMRYLGWGIGHL
ncbi:hypothetical protein PENSPDRAFT_561883, partial [Peniophora sp. CONT]